MPVGPLWGGGGTCVKNEIKMWPKASKMLSFSSPISVYKQKVSTFSINSECSNASLVYNDWLVSTHWVPGHPKYLYCSEHLSAHCTLHCNVHCTVHYTVQWTVAIQNCWLSWHIPSSSYVIEHNTVQKNNLLYQDCTTLFTLYCILYSSPSLVILLKWFSAWFLQHEFWPHICKEKRWKCKNI